MYVHNKPIYPWRFYHSIKYWALRMYDDEVELRVSDESWNGYENTSWDWVSGIKWISSTAQVPVKLYKKIFASQAKWSTYTKFSNICLHQHQIFYCLRNFLNITIWWDSNQYCVWIGEYHSWPNTLPFRVRYWGANTHFSGSDPSTRPSQTGEMAKQTLIKLNYIYVCLLYIMNIP